MRPAVLLLLAILAAGTAVAQDADRMNSPECRRALEALQAQEAQAPAESTRPRTDRQQIEALRRQAARACLGGTGDPAPSAARSPAPPITVSPPARTQQPPPAPVAPRAPPVAVPPPSPAGIASCDATGCWTTDGTRLRRSGPNLFGPRGPCTVRGTVLQCP
jgi:hypothetical protein